MMAKKAAQESQEDQSKRFLKAVQALEDAGELNPTEADQKMQRVMGNLTTKPNPSKS